MQAGRNEPSKKKGAGLALPGPAMPRPEADALWLARLRAEGVGALVPHPPAPPEALLQGVEEFNAGAYWKCHETLERVWLITPYPARLFYHGLIKLAAGLLHLERRNAVGARLQLTGAAQLLEPFTPQFLGLRTDTLLEAARERLQSLRAETPAPPALVRGQTQGRRVSKRRVQGTICPCWMEVERLSRPQIQRTETLSGAERRKSPRGKSGRGKTPGADH